MRMRKINRTVQICIHHRDADFVMYVDEFNYYPETPATGPTYSCGGEPGTPAEIEIIRGSLEIDALQENKTALDIKKQFMESDRLFWILIDEHLEYIEEVIWNSEESFMDDEPPYDPRDYEY